MVFPLILLPGSLCDDAMWAPQVAALADDFEVRVVSLEGFDSVEAMARHVLDSVPDEKFALAGFSLGGFVALQIMRVASKRVSHLALLSTSAVPDAGAMRPVRMERIAAPASDLPKLVDAFADMLGGPNSEKQMLATCRATMQRLGPGNYSIQQQALMNRPDSRDVLAMITCPTLVMAGREDRAVPVEAGRELGSKIPDAHYVELADSGHMITLERGDLVSREIRALLAR